MRNILKKLVIMCIFVFPMVVLADEGAKPSIDVKIKNLDTTNYMVDLFVYDDGGKNYNVDANYNGNGLTDDEVNKLHKLNFDGWISESTRWNSYLMFADCSGNKDFTNHFGYFGTPDVFKIVIINNDTGDIKISKKIKRKFFNSIVTVDYSSMKYNVSNNGSSREEINNVGENNNYFKTICNFIIALIITIVIELVIAVIFKICNYKLIFITNLVTNILLQTILIILNNNYITVFIVGEVIVIIGELFVYLSMLKNIDKKKIILYTLVANVLTILISILFINI